MAKIICPQCKTRFTIPLTGSSDVTCPKCRTEFDMTESAPPDAAAPAKPKKAEKPKPESKPKPKPEAKAEAFLNTCPICSAGQVVAKKAGDDERFVCTNCSSVMEQTIYGYTYVEIDPQFQADKGDLLHESLTKDDLDFMVQEAGGKDDKDSTDFAGAPAVTEDRVASILGGPSDDEDEAAPASAKNGLLDDILDDDEDKPTKGKSLTASKTPKAGLLDDILDDEAGAPAKAAPKPAGSRRSKKKKRKKVLMWQVDEERLERRRKRNLGSSAMLPRVRTKSRSDASDAGESSDSGEPAAKPLGAPLDASDEALAVATAPDDTGSDMEAATVGSSAQMATALDGSADKLPAEEGSSVEMPAASAGSSDEAPAADASSAESLAAASAESSGELPPAEPASAESMPAVAAPAPALAGVVVLAVALSGICAFRAVEGVFTKLAANGALSKLGAGCSAWRQDVGKSGLVGATRAIVGRNRDAFDRLALLAAVLVLAWRLAVASRALDYLFRTSPTAGDRTRGNRTINTFLLLLFAGGAYALAVTCGASSLVAAPLLLVCALVASIGWMLHVRALLPKIERRGVAALSVWIMSNAAFAIVIYVCAKGIQVGGAAYNGVEVSALALWLNAAVNWQCASGTLGDEEAGARPRWPMTVIALLAGAIAAVALCA